MTILVVGDANADLSATTVRFPSEGDDSPLASLAHGSGGAGVNVATALALLGTPARLLARVGGDPLAHTALRAAHAAGVDLSLIQHDSGAATGMCFVVVSPGGERTFLSFRGANTAFDQPTDVVPGARWLHVCGHALLEQTQRHTTLALIRAANAHGVPVSLDVCLPLLRAHHAATLALLPNLHILFANQPEAALLCPGHAPAEAATLLAEHTPLVAVKLGAHGCIVATRAEQPQPCGAPDVAVRDTNGCGDAFAAGFLHAHWRGAAPMLAARFANCLGALAATQPGSADGLPSHATIRTFVASQPELAALV